VKIHFVTEKAYDLSEDQAWANLITKNEVEDKVVVIENTKIDEWSDTNKGQAQT
jgi:hypothetical protein